MRKSTPVRYQEVWLQEQHAGWLCEADGITRFVATEQYLTNTRRPTLSISITPPGSDDLSRSILGNQFDPAIYRERGQLPPFFAGLLPEGSLRRRLASTRLHAEDMDDFGLLASAGEDLPGAVKVVPARLDHLTPTALALGATGGADGLNVRVPEGAAKGAASLAGMQDKLALSQVHRKFGYCLPSEGRLTTIIAKLPAPNDDDQVMNEYACMQLAAMAGVEVAQCQPEPMKAIIDQPDLIGELGAATRFLKVERFDRSLDGAIHMEDACQLLTLMPPQKYAAQDRFVTLLAILNRLSSRGIEDVRALFIRRTVNTLLGNSDAHLKNISVLYRDGRLPQLAPAYDIVCVASFPSFRGYAVNVAIDKQQRLETHETYAAIAKAAGISQRIAKTAVKQTVTLAKESWPSALRKMDVSPRVSNEILHRLATLPLSTTL